MRLFVVKYLFLFILVQHFPVKAQNSDLRILISLNKKEKPIFDKTMLLSSKSVMVFVPLSLITIAADAYIHKNEVMRRNTYKSAITIGLAALSTSALKISINRPRPKKQYPERILERDQAGPYSFPSGHATSAFAAATALSLSYNKWYVTLPSYLYAGLVGYSRMRLGMHFPSDVLGGMVIGIGTGVLVWQLDRAINGF